jgi:hypothetical protein
MSSFGYNFKKITVVPTAKDFIDATLSKTQRKTPTVIHKHMNISRIRGFYLRAVTNYVHHNYKDKIEPRKISWGSIFLEGYFISMRYLGIGMYIVYEIFEILGQHSTFKTK